MASLKDILEKTLKMWPHLGRFIHHCPHGIITQTDHIEDIECQIYPTFCSLKASPSTTPKMLIAPLIYLDIIITENIDPYQTVSFNSELLWFYAFAKASTLIPESDGQNIAPSLMVNRWSQILQNLLSASTLNTTEQLQITMIEELIFEGANLQKGPHESIFKPAWKIAQASANFISFFSIFEKLAGELPPPEKSSFMRSASPSFRAVIQESHGIIHGIFATSSPDWVGTKEKLQIYLSWAVRNPIVYENHDLDRPVGLAHGHQLIKPPDKDYWAVSGKVFIIDVDHWNNREIYKGFSLGIKNEE